MFTLHLHRSSAMGSAAERPGGRRVQAWRDQDDAACAFGYAGDGWWAMEWPGWAIFRFGPAVGDGVEVIHRSDVAPERIEDTYRRSVLPLQLQALGCEAIHASAVATDAGILAFCGERRAGKSTFAFALGRRGLVQRADDAIVLDVQDGRITAVPLPFAPRLRPASAAFFAAEDDVPLTAGAGPEPLRAVFMLSQDACASPCTLEPLAGTAAFRALLAHAHIFEPQNPAAKRRLVSHYLEVAGAVPVINVRYAPRLADLPQVLDRLLVEAGVALPVTQ